MAEQNVNLIVKQEDKHEEEELVISFSAIFRKLKKYFVVWFMVAVLVGGAIGGVSVFFNTTSSSPVHAVVSFNYDGIEKGLNPDGTEFDYSSLKNPKVIERALKECDMDLNLLESIRSNIRIEGKVPEDAYQRLNTYRNVLDSAASGQLAAANAMLDVTWYSTQYNITFKYGSTGLTRSDAVQVLNAMLDAYNDYFFEQFGYNEALGNALSALDYTEYDYAEAVDMFRTTLNQLNRYVTGLATDDNARFRSNVTGYTFADLKTAIASIQSLDLDLISSLINVNNLTKDKERLKGYYEFRIENLERQKKTNEETLTAVETAFAAYEKDQVIVFSDAVGGNTQTTVSSQAYDDLITRRLDAQAALSDTNQNIAYYKQRLQTLNKAASTSKENLERIESDLAKLNTKVNDMIKLVEDTADDYYQNVSLSDAFNILVPATSAVAATVKSGISKAVVPIAGVEVLWFVFYVGLSFVQALIEETNRRKAKKAAAQEAEEAEEKSGSDKKKDEKKA